MVGTGQVVEPEPAAAVAEMTAGSVVAASAWRVVDTERAVVAERAVVETPESWQVQKSHP